MGRMTENDAKVISCMDENLRAQVLYAYLVQGRNMNDIGEDVLDNRSSQPGQPVSALCRGYGFHEGKGRGAYRKIPMWIIEEFVNRYYPENTYNGLDEGTFDHFVRQYAEQQRKEEERQAELRRQQAAQQAEQQRKQREWEAYQARQAQERARVEAARREEERRKAEEQARKEAARKAAIDRGDHLDWMRKAETQFNKGNYREAKNCARQGIQIQEVLGLTYLMAVICNALDEKDEAEKYAKSCMYDYNKESQYAEGSKEWAELCRILVRCSNYYNGAPWVIKLWEKGMISVLDEEDAKKACDCIFHRYYGRDEGFDKDVSETRRETIYDLILFLIEHRLSDGDASLSGWADYPNGIKMSLRSKCRAVGMMVQRGEYDRARVIADTLDPSEVMSRNDNQELGVFLGKCHFETDDHLTALMYWQGDYFDIKMPLDLLVYMGYGEDYLSCLPESETDRGRQLVNRAQDFLNGKFPASTYYRDYPGYEYLFRSGINDFIWKYDRNSDSWSKVPYDPSNAQRAVDGVKGLLGKMFGH